MPDQTPPRPRVTPRSGRIPALDQLRGFVIVLVVLHHSILAYCTFGHVDRLHYVLSTSPIVDAHKWSGFDVAVKLNDGFFMPLLFLLSGLFVRDGLTRKGARTFLRDRLLRLGLPFAVAELTVVPLAYYPSFLQAGGAAGFPRFWIDTVTAGPWPSGPPWFIGILLLFDAAAALVFTVPRLPTARTGSSSFPGPGRCFGLLSLVSVLLYLPLLSLFGPYRWLSVGPVAIQASRVLLYAAYFAAGVMLGLSGPPNIIRYGGVLARHWFGWVVLGGLAAVAFIGISPTRAVAVIGLPAWSAGDLAGLILTLYCAATCFALPSLFLRFGGNPGPIWSSLSANSFAIYLLHYPVVIWIQYAFLPLSFGAGGKGLATFSFALTVSWLLAAGLRQLPGVNRLI